MARAGGLGGLYGLSHGHWASGQREAPSQSLVQPHSCGLQGPPATTLPPVHPLFGWSQAPQTSGQGWLGFLLPSPLTGTERLREGRDRDRQRGRELETQRDPRHREGDRGSKQGQMFQHREKQNWGGVYKGGKGAAGGMGRGGGGGSLPPAVLVVLTSLIKRPLAQLNWLFNRNCL